MSLLLIFAAKKQLKKYQTQASKPVRNVLYTAVPLLNGFTTKYKTKAERIRWSLLTFNFAKQITYFNIEMSLSIIFFEINEATKVSDSSIKLNNLL